jgi:tetratricopeptide (TPR) repeat protein
LKIKEELGNKSGIATTLHQLGMIHQDQGDYDKAIEKFNQSLKIKEELGDKSGIANTLGQIGRIYETREDHKNALKNYLICYSIFGSLKSPYIDKIGEEVFKKYYDEIVKEN